MINQIIDRLIKINTEDLDDVDRACEIAFSSGKGHCGCGFSNLEKKDTRFFVAGKFCDIVRVFSALKNNGYKPVMRISEDD